MKLNMGDTLRQLRRARNLTQEEVAAQLGISFQAVSKWERNEGYPDITLLPVLARFFGVSASGNMPPHWPGSCPTYTKPVRTRWCTSPTARKSAASQRKR